MKDLLPPLTHRRKQRGLLRPNWRCTRDADADEEVDGGRGKGKGKSNGKRREKPKRAELIQMVSLCLIIFN